MRYPTDRRTSNTSPDTEWCACRNGRAKCDTGRRHAHLRLESQWSGVTVDEMRECRTMISEASRGPLTTLKAEPLPSRLGSSLRGGCREYPVP